MHNTVWLEQKESMVIECQLSQLSSSTNFKRVNSKIYVLILKANLFLKSPISKFSHQILFNFDIQMSQKQKTPNTDCAVCTNPNFQPIAWNEKGRMSLPNIIDTTFSNWSYAENRPKKSVHDLFRFDISNK